MTSSRLPFLLSAIVLAAAFPANGHAGTYNDTANGITFSFTTSDAPPYTATITDVSFYQDPDPNPVNPGDPVCVPGTPIDPNDPDSELYYPTYASVQFPDSVISDEGGGPMQYTVTAIASHVLEGLAGAMGNGGAIDVTLSTAMYGGLVTIEDGAFSLWNPQPDPDASSIAVTVSDGSFPDSLEYFGYQSTSVAFNSTESDSQGVEYQGDWVVGFVPNSGRPQQVINLHRAKGIVGGAFEYASPRIVSVILPSTLKAIPTRAFAGCTGLGKLSGKGTVTIPASVEIIGECAFQGDSYITNFVFEGDAPQVGPNAFDGVGSDVLNLQYGDLPIATVHTGTSGWGPEGSVWNGLRITYATAPTSYTITWRDDDNTLLPEESWPVGSRPTHADPYKYPDSQYTYTFADWTPAISVVTSNTTYAAVYSRTLRTYPITWLNEDGSTFAQTSVAYDTVPAYNGQPPVKATDAQYAYAFAGWTPDPVAVRGPASYTATFTSSPRPYTITWLDDDGTVLDTDTLASGTTPSRQGPTKADVPPYSYAFAAWTPVIVPVTNDASYTATYTRIADLSTLSGDWTATDGDVLTNATAHAVTVPGGATVTINGVTVTGGGAGNSPVTFAEGGDAFTSAFAPGANGTWRLTAYAELASGSAAGLADSQIKVRRAGTVAGLATAEPTTSGVTVLEKVPAVKVDLEVSVPPNAGSQFFRVEFGE
jgi:hypothetical protein